MITDSTRREQLVSSLADREYREAFVADQIRLGVPLQIKALREDREWSQDYLGKQMQPPMVQESVWRIENPHRANVTIATLLRVAAAFDVALIVRFAPFSELLDSTPWLSGREGVVPSYAEDNGLHSTIQIVDTVAGEDVQVQTSDRVERTQAKAVILDGSNRFHWKPALADVA